jgi:hypothetical protein
VSFLDESSDVTSRHIRPAQKSTWQKLAPITAESRTLLAKPADVTTALSASNAAPRPPAATAHPAQRPAPPVMDFLDFIATYPRHPLVANAQYWIGEAYAQRDDRQALAESKKVGQLAPASAKVADARHARGKRGSD